MQTDPAAAEIAARVNSLNIPDKGTHPPRTVYEVCRCCGQPNGWYWVIPRGWEPSK